MGCGQEEHRPQLSRMLMDDENVFQALQDKPRGETACGAGASPLGGSMNTIPAFLGLAPEQRPHPYPKASWLSKACVGEVSFVGPFNRNIKLTLSSVLKDRGPGVSHVRGRLKDPQTRPTAKKGVYIFKWLEKKQ